MESTIAIVVFSCFE